MSISLGLRLQIRSLIQVAAEPIPFFWPMRTFIHHNPLHGLEHLPFAEALDKGAALFHGRSFLPRNIYQRYLAEGKVDEQALSQEIIAFVASQPKIAELNLADWLMTLFTTLAQPVISKRVLADVADVHALLNGKPLPAKMAEATEQQIREYLQANLLAGRPVYEVLDHLSESEFGTELDETMIKACLDFFDEGQSVWEMPNREQGFFQAWREIAIQPGLAFCKGAEVNTILAQDETPEGVIAYVLKALEVPEADWENYLTKELARLHGWVGFIRWRTSAKHYYWSQKYPADLIEFMAIRLTLALALLRHRCANNDLQTVTDIHDSVHSQPRRSYLRYELYEGQILPAFADDVDYTLATANEKKIFKTFDRYAQAKRQQEAEQQAQRLTELATAMGQREAIKALDEAQLGELLGVLQAAEKREGMMWLQAIEARAIVNLTEKLVTPDEDEAQKRPFAQALFCIDTRSEPYRRHLEAVGDYRTYGIAGFFGVPVSFMELENGNESQLCPVILTPKNLVPEITPQESEDAALISVLDKAVHDLKESVLTPFVTVEAIGLLFGVDMVGKTFAPRSYHHWREHLHPKKPTTRLLVDKLSKEQAQSILRAVQRAIIANALNHEFGLGSEQVSDDVIRGLREAALENESLDTEIIKALGLSAAQGTSFIQRLQSAYRINQSFNAQQLEHLGRIGFTIDEQVNYVSQALRSIGLTDNFARLVLLVGHGSLSQNNPYESALDCGACGGDHGIVSAKVLAQMANKPKVRKRLAEQGIDIPLDTWFLPGLHNTTTDEVKFYNLDLMPPALLVYMDRLRSGFSAASRLCAQERMPTLALESGKQFDPVTAFSNAQRNATDWSQVRPEWGLSRNAYFIVGRRDITKRFSFEGRSFLHSYDYRVDDKQRLLANILTGPLVVGQWINMEHYFSAVDNDRFGSGSKVNHNVAGRFGVMTGNLSDIRTGLPSQTVLKNGLPYHEPLRLITLLEAPLEHAQKAIDAVANVKGLIRNEWIRLLILDPETQQLSLYKDSQWLALESKIAAAYE